ncbi:peptidase [Pontibacillus halophilus JSM 076056 = DSM 19796]|uniref:Peptidase n=1 Tax=Pontibacillus halophilus JSM 076056 = DSM 19796 TaxID=1385510 RepID=A0A0A5GDT2_9BACI|nr:transglutaminaseTgpA domain-containing protein [Pontibacillus halophilus]KGX89285.1 peptidase [Pontibacillus halophilus JSM 076056 = DSM 19796]
MRQFENQNTLYHVLLYASGFFLFWEWLRPLEEVTETSNTSLFVLYAAFCFFLSFLQLPWYITSPLKLFGLAFVLDGLFMSERFLSGDWFGVVIAHVQHNIEVMLSNQWYDMTSLFRSMLFLLLLWLMSYLLYYWFVVVKKLTFFIVLTFIYIGVLDTFTTYDGNHAIVRSFMIAFVMLGLANVTREFGVERMRSNKKKFMQAIVLPLLLIVVAGTAIGYAAPKLAPQWPDPVPFIKSTATGAGEGNVQGIQKVGYGTNDSSLGGSFVQDDTPILTAVSKEDNYWRIESKDEYTGKGWVRSEEGRSDEVIGDAVNMGTFSDNVETESSQARITMSGNQNFDKLVYPYGVSGVQDITDNVRTFEVNDTTGVIQSNEGTVGAYNVTYDKPSFSIERLREAGSNYPDEIIEKYTQLPSDLPQRVTDLSEEVTAEENSTYDKAVTVRDYFSQNGFTYRTTDVPVPDQNEDYVDQFLFETQYGYCDNYSTAMVVMLRSIDIPARWVKGFTGGEATSDEVDWDGERYNVYEVTSANAHSWVEVYFPGTGWVPFEPTQGFSSSVEFNEEEEEEALNEETDTEEEVVEDEEDIQAPLPEMEDEETTNNQRSNVSNSATPSGWWWVIGGLAVAIGVALYLLRYRIRTIWIKRKLTKEHSLEAYEEAYLFLLKVLKKKGIGRDEHQTLREYAAYIDRFYQWDEMKQLTHYYERMLYRGELGGQPWQEMLHSWNRLIRKTLS